MRTDVKWTNERNDQCTFAKSLELKIEKPLHRIMSDAAKGNTSFDLADLLEYDEFDGGYDEDGDAGAARLAGNSRVETGVPLSVELNESMCQEKSDSARLQQPIATGELLLSAHSDCGYSKGADIFLRIDSNDDASSTNTTTTITTASGPQSNNKLSIDSQTIGDGPSTSSGQYSLSLDGDGDVELQYENEFIDQDDDDVVDSFSQPSGRHHLKTHQSGHHHHLLRRPAVENDNEQLLFEGIFPNEIAASLQLFFVLVFVLREAKNNLLFFFRSSAFYYAFVFIICCFYDCMAIKMCLTSHSKSTKWKCRRWGTPNWPHAYFWHPMKWKTTEPENAERLWTVACETKQKMKCWKWLLDI